MSDAADEAVSGELVISNYCYRLLTEDATLSRQYKLLGTMNPESHQYKLTELQWIDR